MYNGVIKVETKTPSLLETNVAGRSCLFQWSSQTMPFSFLEAQGFSIQYYSQQ
jgi:hypothetical protein